MKPFSLNTIDNRVDISNRDGLGRRFSTALISITILFGLLSVFSTGLSIFVFFIVLIMTSRLTRHAQKDWITLKKCTGKVNFSDKSIDILPLPNNIQLKDISQIKLFGDYYQGYTIGSRDIIHNGLYDFLIINIDGQQSHFKFIVLNKEEFQDLIDFFKFLYSNFKIDLREKIGSEQQTGFLLRHDRSYKNIQELKQQFLKNGQQNCT